MTMNSRHWSIIGVLGIDAANRAFSFICGHSIDVTTIDYISLGYTLIIGGADFVHTHFGNYIPPSNSTGLNSLIQTAAQILAPKAPQTPSSNTDTTGFTEIQ